MYITIDFLIPEQQHQNEVGILCAQNFTKFVIQLMSSLSRFLGGNVSGLSKHLGTRHIVGTQ